MNKVYLFVLVLLSASFTGCIDFEDLPVEEETDVEEENSSNIENEPKYSTISRATEYDSLNDCPNGGVIIEYGIDVNGNGTLEDTEVDGLHIVCHGRDGEDGTDGEHGVDGADGEDGEDGENSGLSDDTLLTRIDDPDESLGCDFGGRVISYGLDNGDGNGISANGKLEEGEIDTSTTLCTNRTVGLMSDISIGSGNTNMYDFIEFNGDVFFTATTNEYGRELWTAELNTGNVSLLKDIYPGIYGSSPQDFEVMGDLLYFSANNGVNGTELWFTDGTEEGTMMVADIYEGSPSSAPDSITAFQGMLIFEANHHVGMELWSWHPVHGAQLLKDIFPGNNSYGISNGSYPSGFVEFQGSLYFNARDSWDEGGTGNYELWKTDGTEDGTTMVKDINSDGTSSYVNQLTVFGDMLYFSARGNDYNSELWKTNGTEEGTVMVKDIRPGDYGSSPGNFEVMGDMLYFQANDGSNGSELWATDGTESGTVMVADIFDGASGGNPSHFTVVGSTLYFNANSGTNGSELWKTDGTTSGTYMVKDIYPGSGSSSPNYLTVVGNGFGGEVLYFSASDGSFGYELWRTDGTVEGTAMVKDIRYGSDSGLEPSSGYEYLYAVGDILLFTANDGHTGYELYWNSFPETSIFYE
jgi:ELWxxDGT repeat protein